MSGSIRQIAIEFEAKIVREASSVTLIDLARQLRNAIHSMSFNEVLELLKAFDEAIPDDEDSYYFRTLANNLKIILHYHNLIQM